MTIINNKSCQLLEQYLGYLTVIKGRSENTINEYRNDLLMFLKYIKKKTRHPADACFETGDFSDINIEFITSISVRKKIFFE